MNRSIYFLVSSLFLCSFVQANNAIYLYLNNLSYEGNWKKYASLDDAKSGNNQLASGTVPMRDVGVHLETNERGVAESFYFITLWGVKESDNSMYHTTSNVNAGFMQIYDMDASSVTYTMAGHDPDDMTRFSMKVSGANAIDRDPDGAYKEYTRAGVGNAEDISKSSSIWHEYDFDITFTGLDTVEEPDRMHSQGIPYEISGTAELYVEHIDTRDPGNNGFYRIDLDIGDHSQTALVRPDLIDENPANRIEEISEVPEPSACALLFGTGAMGLALLRRKLWHLSPSGIQ